MNYIFSLLFLFLSLSLHSQILKRSSNDLTVILSESAEKLTSCKDAKNIGVKLLEKTRDENALTCSDQNAWKLVATLENQKAERYVFDNQPLGIYKVVVKMPLHCSKSKKYSKYKIAKIYESNILNEIADIETPSPIQTSEQLISVFPNPSAEKIWVSIESDAYDEQRNYIIQVVNGAGQLVKEEVVTERIFESAEIDISGYPAGQYTLVVLKDDKIFASQKIAKITK